MKLASEPVKPIRELSIRDTTHHRAPLRVSFEWAGNQVWDDLARKLILRFERIGELRLVQKPEDIQYLEELDNQGKPRGVTDLEIKGINWNIIYNIDFRVHR